MNVRALSAAAALVLTTAVSLPAHHSLAAEYDPKAPITLAGRITKVEWANPHSFIELECATPEGGVEHWRVEVGPPAVLTKAEISRDMLAVNTALTINAFRAKNGSLRAWGLDVTFPNGVTIEVTDDPMQTGVSPTFMPPSALERLMSSQPFLPYLVAILPGVVLLAGLAILRYRRRDRRSVPQ